MNNGDQLSIEEYASGSEFLSKIRSYKALSSGTIHGVSKSHLWELERGQAHLFNCSLIF